MKMRCIVLFFIVLLNIHSLKTESVDYTLKNSRMDIPISLHEEKMKDLTLLSPQIDDSSEHEWNNIELKYQPNNYRKIVNLNDNEEYKNEEIDFTDDQFKSIDQLNEAQLIQLSKYLIKLLQRPDLWEAPLILIKDPQDNVEEKTFPLEFGLQNISKRSRYYRRYPWKRQNSRSYNSMDYDPYNACNPTRNDVFQLLGSARK
ncbi:PREDICTED: uncharacterized protein LOC105362969 [Ceratosolen solmsi marchali]|uniref:Uncharacterized protein LOC105362969 n=1 Tax=Ceratosolen solmsi marchali TaxID=326594 RepID=A0AAJ6YIT7_9HYME|nr:PREDICTED: uncharacterized protein LOC105362969 [Ceratosolen solmsi marchali]